jgi:hypothetical protein
MERAAVVEALDLAQTGTLAGLVPLRAFAAVH